MKYKTFKCMRNFDELFTREKETKEIQIEIDEVKVGITEHQFGLPINKPYVNITIKGKGVWSMDFSTFIKKAINME